ncbi:MlaD family protein [Niabella drilacis]|uniref:Phospholipid/cholesterol/gamma-HCH transport system substrate-binding protein n=1 Tax=Niabella drilacis (strain DSM 25811 / CCM 8410 / CCUG 62505 / LMG 26954 / E90) TaxID=1285928 RepID=A0A1G6T921_NIADE|nr:MlaD family protein [Niabella drilacis]SDD25548.1 phospholipid/cholesterol/gamma-HCH transport system substrate-binding protein [Niabella drilacis]
MKTTDSRRATTVGIFIVLGLIIFAAAILVLGGQKKSFMQSIQIKGIFHNVGGLSRGNNVWYSGVKVGTIKKITFMDHSRIEVLMNIDKNARPFIHKDVRARISSDGLVGNKIIALDGGTAQAAPIEDGDVIIVEASVSTEEMMDTLQVNNKNLVAVTGNLRVIMENITAGRGTLGKLITDPSVYEQLNRTLALLHKTAGNTQQLTEGLAGYAARLQKPGVLASDLVSDTVVFNKLRGTATQLQEAAVQANKVAHDLQAVSANVNSRLNTNESPAGVLLNDSATARQLQQTIRNLESSTGKLDTNMEALRHNFLFRGYFRKQEKLRRKQEKQQKAELQ